MNKLKEIGWFTADQKPVRVGAYKTRFHKGYAGGLREGYSWWSGRRWSNQRSKLSDLLASRSREAPGVQHKEWCGVSPNSLER